MSAFTLQAQTTSIKKYRNGMPDTIWHIKGQDTFLTESFQLNGRLRAQHWRKDSTYLFDRHGNISDKFFLFKNHKTIPIPFSVSFYKSNLYQEQIAYHSNGKIHMHSLWKNDSCFQINQYDPQGKFDKSEVIRIHPPSLFEHEEQSKTYKIVTLLNTFTHFTRQWQSWNGKLLSFEERYKNKLIQSIRYDTNEQVRFKWALDSNVVIPFKDNGLCLYGFVNLKSDTIISARYEWIHDLVSNEYFKYYIVQRGGQYGVTDEFGNLIIPEIWLHLALHEANHNGWEEELNNTYLQCQGKLGHGILKLNGQIALEPIYQGTGDSENGLFEVKIGNAYGIVDAKGQIEVMPRAELVKFTEIPHIYKTEGDEENSETPKKRYGLIRKDGKVLLSNDFQEITMIDTGYFKVKSAFSGEEGIFDVEKGWIFDTAYQISLHYLHKYLYLTKNQKVTVLHLKTLKPILPVDYQYFASWQDSCFIMYRAGKLGLFDPARQQWLIPMKYDVLTWLYDSLFAAKQGNRWEIINYQGQNIRNQYFTNIGYFNESNTRFVQQGDSLLFFNRESYPLFAHPFDLDHYSWKFEDHLKQCTVFDGTELVITQKCHVLNPPHFKLKKIEQNYAIGIDTLHNMQILIDTLGKTYPFLPQYEIANMQMEDSIILVLDQKTRKLGAVRPDGTVILPCEYFGLHPIDDKNVLWAKKEASKPKTDEDFDIHNKESTRVWGMELSYLDAGWTMHNKTGNLLTQTVFDYPMSWIDTMGGIGIGQVGGKQGLWRSSGENILPPNYNRITYNEADSFFYLFETQSINNQRVSFADARGRVISDGLFTKMSAFSNGYAFVETQAGIGIVQKNGEYLIAPQPAALQQSSLDLMGLMLPMVDNEYDAPPLYDTLFLKQKNFYNALSADKQLKMNNLLIQNMAERYFLLPERITVHRNLSNRYLVDSASGWKSLETRWQDSRLSTGHYEVQKVYQTEDYLNFWTHFTELFQYASDRRADPTRLESLNFKWDGKLWQRIGLKDFLDLKPSNMGYFTQLFTQKLSALRNVEIDCSNPSTYFEMVEKAFWITETGLELNLIEQQMPEVPIAIPLKFSWAELKPILKVSH